MNNICPWCNKKMANISGYYKCQIMSCDLITYYNSSGIEKFYFRDQEKTYSRNEIEKLRKLKGFI